MLPFAHNDNFISEKEFLLLYDLDKSRNLNLGHWSCDQFDLDLLSDDECTSEFRFYRRDVYLLAEVLQIPNQISCYYCVIVNGIKALCILLKRSLHPCRYSDILATFAKLEVKC